MIVDRTGGVEIRRRDELRIPVGSETVAAARYEPIGMDRPLPALLMYVPYHKDDFVTYARYDPLNRYLAGRGYEVVVADMVGTGASTGHVGEMFRAREGEEGAEIVRWLADQDWTNGRVGIYGKSYGGITALWTAAHRPEPLEAIVPIHTPYLGFRNAVTYTGMPELFNIFMFWLTSMQALDVTPPSMHDPEGHWATAWQERLESARNRTPWAIQFFEHLVRDDYWADKDIPVEEVDVPTLAVGGWRDSYTRDTLEYFDAIDAKKRLLLGPWRHRMPHRGREVAIDLQRRIADWFDGFLKDGDAADEVPRDGEIVYWTERGGGGQEQVGDWRRRDDWPSVRSAGTPGDGVRSLALSPEGLVDPDPYDAGHNEWRYEFDHTVGLVTTDPIGVGLEPQDTNADDVRSLTFDTPPLERPFEFTGTGSATLRVEPTTADFPLSVRIEDVSPDGTSTLVTHGTLRAACRDGLASPESLDPGTEYELEVPLQPRSHLFETDHAVRVAVAAAFFPEHMPVGDHGSFVVRSSADRPSVVRLPGRSRADADYEDAVHMGAPTTDRNTEPEQVTDRSVSWETTRERTANVARATMESSLSVDLPHADYTETGTFETEVAADNPGSFGATNRFEISISRPEEEIEVLARNHLTRNLIQMTTRVRVDGETYFEQRWTA